MLQPKPSLSALGIWGLRGYSTFRLAPVARDVLSLPLPVLSFLQQRCERGFLTFNLVVSTGSGRENISPMNKILYRMLQRELIPTFTTLDKYGYIDTERDSKTRSGRNLLASRPTFTPRGQLSIYQPGNHKQRESWYDEEFLQRYFPGRKLRGTMARDQSSFRRDVAQKSRSRFTKPAAV